MQRLKGKICLVTGAARGIGEAIVRAFHDEGARVIVNDLGGDVIRTIGRESYVNDIFDTNFRVGSYRESPSSIGDNRYARFCRKCPISVE